MDDGPKDAQVVQAALDRLAEELAGSKFRAALREDPADAVKSAGIDADDLPDGLLGALGLMSDEELQIAARVQLSLKRSVSQRLPDPLQVCILF